VYGVGKKKIWTSSQWCLLIKNKSMPWSYKEKYNNDPEFREKERARNKIYANSERGKAVKLKGAMEYQNSEHGFITSTISAIFKPSSCKKRGLWPAITRPGIWEEFKIHRFKYEKEISGK
jgi:hypothetical protein